METIVFSIVNPKGGVGKTTTAINLSVSLAQKNISTLLIDLDPKGNTTSGLGLPNQAGHGLYLPLAHPKTDQALEKILPTRIKNLFIIPSEIDLTTLEIELGNKENYSLQLKNCLAPILKLNHFKVIILDCPPSLGLLSINSLTVSDYLIVTLPCEQFAVEEMEQILQTVKNLQESNINPRLTVGGVLMTFFDIRTNVSKQIFEKIKNAFPELLFKTVIPRSVRLSQASSLGQSIFEYDPLSSGAKAYDTFGTEFIDRFKLLSL